MFSNLNRYILATWFKPFTGMFLFVSAIFLIQKVTIWLPKFLEHEASWDLAASLFLAMLPIEMTLLIPIVFFFSLIKLVRELQSNSEIDAMYAGGQSILNIFTPVLWVAFLLTLLMFWLTLSLAPAGKVQAYHVAKELASLKVEPTFQPKKFVDSIEHIVLYFEGYNPDGSYAKIMLTDSRNKTQGRSIYFAERATISRTDSGLLLSMFQGSQMSGEKGALRSTNFSHYQIEVPLNLHNNIYQKKTPDWSPTFLSGEALWHSLQQDKTPLPDIAEWNYRLVASLSVLLLFLFAVPISLQAKRAKHSGAYLVALGIMVFIDQAEFYLFKKVEQGLLPWWSFWACYAALVAIAGWMFYTVNQRGSIHFPWELKRRRSPRQVRS